MEIENCFLLGSIIKTHGLDGRVSVRFDADDYEEYKEVELVFLEIQEKLVPFFISSISFGAKESGIIKFDFIDTIDQAKEITGCKAYLPNDDRAEIGDDEYYTSHLIGYTAFDSTKGEIGIIEEIIEYPKNQLFRIDHQGQEILIPVSDDFITELDKPNKKVTLTLPEGLLDLFEE